MNVDWGDIVVDNNRVGYTVPRRDQWVKFLAIDFDNDIVHVGPTARARTQLRIMPDGSAVYGANRGLSPSDIERFTVSNLERISWRDSPYHGHYYMAGNLWIDEAGDTILVAGGSVFSTSENRNDDMVYEETLAPLGYPSWADHSEEEGRWVVIQNDGIRFYSDTTYNQVSTQMVDSIFFDSPVNDPSLDSVYYSQDGQSLIVIAHSEAVDENNYIVQVLE